jgi:RNAse (barnase) inhibitor barstar
VKNGVYRSRNAGRLPNAVRVDLSEPVFDAFARALELPEWFGRNWDALEDCLTERSVVLVIENAQPGDELGTLVDVLDSVAQYWKERRKRFAAIFVDPEAKLDLPELPE